MKQVGEVGKGVEFAGEADAQQCRIKSAGAKFWEMSRGKYVFLRRAGFDPFVRSQVWNFVLKSEKKTTELVSIRLYFGFSPSLRAFRFWLLETPCHPD